jgi:hypothetical protein
MLRLRRVVRSRSAQPDDQRNSLGLGVLSSLRQPVLSAAQAAHQSEREALRLFEIAELELDADGDELMKWKSLRLTDQEKKIVDVLRAGPATRQTLAEKCSPAKSEYSIATAVHAMRRAGIPIRTEEVYVFEEDISCS